MKKFQTMGELISYMVGANAPNELKDAYFKRKSFPLACATWCIMATPTSTRNRRFIVLQTPPTGYYATSRKVAYVVL